MGCGSLLYINVVNGMAYCFHLYMASDLFMFTVSADHDSPWNRLFASQHLTLLSPESV